MTKSPTHITLGCCKGFGDEKPKPFDNILNRMDGKGIMKRNIAILLLAGLVILTLACGGTAPTSAPDQAQLETMVAATLQAVTQEAANVPTQPSGISVSFQNVSFTIPDGLATGAQSEIVPRSESSDDMPYWETYPEHTMFTLSRVDTFVNNFDMRIAIIPAEEYKQMAEVAAERILLLQQKLAGGDFREVLVLPPFNAALVIEAQQAKVDFPNGSGIRSIQEYHQAPVPITNDYLIYSFQGITNDGKYYVSVIAPIRASVLVDESYNPDPNATTPTPVVPEGGVAFPAILDFDSPEYDQYYQAVNDKLSQAATDQFTPSITTLDALVQSILIQ